MILRSVASTGAQREAGEPPENADRLGREQAVQPAILRAIELLLERYFEPITLSALAAEVYVSPFHFSRIFAKATGVTPGRFLTAVRLFEAKRLLLTTSLTVSDIVCSVGYSSVGTFTSRFVRAVGMTPTEYREPDVGELLVAHSAYFQRLPSQQSLREVGRGCASQPMGTGHLDVDLVVPDDAAPATVLVGVFADNVPQRGPVAFGGSANTRSGRVTVHGVPEGNWTVIAIADHSRHAKSGPAFTVGTASAAVSPFDAPGVTVRLRRPALTDPPIAITLASRPTPSSRQQFATQRPHLRAVA